MWSSILHYTEGALVFVLILMVLVAAHEFGHYLFARLFNMGVEEFSIGMFGKGPLVTWFRRTYRISLKPGDEPFKRSVTAGLSFEGGNSGLQPEPVVVEGPNGKELEETTVFTIRPVPIGGFVRIKGMMPEEDGSEVRVPGGFYSKPAWQRFIVLLAGPVFSILAGVLVMIPVYTFVGDVRFSNVPVLGVVVTDTPAQKAGLKTGDRIVAMNGRPIHSFYEITQTVRDSAGVPLRIVYQRAGQTHDTTVVPILSKTPIPVKGPDLQLTGEMRRQGLMGVMQVGEVKKLSVPEAAVTALELPVTNVRLILSMFREPDTAKVTVAGPAGMLTATSAAVQDGFVDVIKLAALISIALGIFNLLPIYPLDGGQMVVAVAEMLRGGRRLSLRVQTLVGTIGLGLVLLIFVGVCTIDFGRLTDKSPESPFPVTPPGHPQHPPKK